MPTFVKHINISKISGFILITTLFCLCEILSRLSIVDNNYLPPISTIAYSLCELIRSLEIIQHLFITLKRLILGYVLGASFGYLLGFLCGYASRIYYLLELSIEYLRPMPSIALIPIGILFLGIGDALNVAIIGWACSWPVFINTMDGVYSTDYILLNTAKTLGLQRWGIIRKVIIPASLPFVFTGLRIGLGIAIAVVVITEMVASSSGLGFFIITTSLSFRIPEMYAGIIVIGLLGYLLNKAFLSIDKKVLKWQRRFLSTGK
jgi:NitT/TauT family transport system permease protein